MTLTEYKIEITEIFRKNSRRGFADWRQCGNLCRDLTRFLEKSAIELTGAGRYKDLFGVTVRAFVKWSGTDKDDSNGETYDFFATERVIQGTRPPGGIRRAAGEAAAAEYRRSDNQ